MTQNEIEQLKQELAEQRALADYQRALLVTLANSAYEALIVTDREQHVIAINNSAEELFKRKRPIGEKLSDVTGSAEISLMVDNALSNAEDIFEEQVVIEDLIYRVRTQVIQRDGNFFIGVTLQDITELVRLNRARRDMVANISHELRTPIANIRLIIDGLFLEQSRPGRKASINSLQAIARETDALLWMAEELLDLSMIESGQAIMRMVPVSVVKMVEDAIERISDMSGEKSIEVVHDISNKHVVLCDRDKIRRVLVNLIHNAIKWSPPGETITLHSKVKADTDEIVIDVLDNGPGVADDQVTRIFERFYQADSSRSISEGTGLGLAICKHIVEAHGGVIGAKGNSKRQGGRFYFSLPKA
jgi:two-component system phosphate regulon sensor histidine kinase PhoR